MCILHRHPSPTNAALPCPSPNAQRLYLTSIPYFYSSSALRESRFIRRLPSRLEHLIHMPRAASAAENVLANPSTCSSSSIV